MPRAGRYLPSVPRRIVGKRMVTNLWFGLSWNRRETALYGFRINAELWLVCTVLFCVFPKDYNCCVPDLGRLS